MADFHLLQLLRRTVCITVLASCIVWAADPPDKTVRVFIVFPNDVPIDSAYPRGIAKVMIASWFGVSAG